MTKTNPKFRSAYDGRGKRHLLTFDPALARTKQEFKDQCDVNKIVANFTRTGRLDQLQKAQGMYIDSSMGPQTYQESLNLIIRARDTFQALPSDVRAKYGNDVQNFLAAAEQDPEGLFSSLTAVQADVPPPATPVAPAAPAAPAAPSAPVPGPVDGQVSS